MIVFDPYSEEDHRQLFDKLNKIRREYNREGYLTLRFSPRAVALINDKYRSIGVRFPQVLDENSSEQQLAEGYRIRPVIQGIEDRVSGIVVRYSAHMVPKEAGCIELAVEGKRKTYECHVFTETVIAYDVSRTKPPQGLPKSWQQQTLATKIRNSLERLLRNVKK